MPRLAKHTESGPLRPSAALAPGRAWSRVSSSVVWWLTRGPKGSLWAVLVLYTAVSTGYWGLPILGHWTTRTVGSGTDPLNIFVWSMAWWPYALTHGINPLIVNKVFVPVVTNAGWRTLVPLLSIVASPLTLIAGPVASYNLAMLMAPPLTATMTYLLMSEFVSKRWVALWAGYMVGFSTYEVSQTLGHLNLTFAALVPLALWLGVRLYRKTIGPTPWGEIAALATVLVGQFLISTEVLLTLSLFGMGALGLAWLILTDDRPRWSRLMGWALVAYGLCVVVLSPWLWMMLQRIPFQQVGNAYAANSTNLLNLLVPTPVTIGGDWFRSLSRSFSAGSRIEASGYLGIPFVALALWAAWRLSRSRGARVVMYVGIVAVVLTLGPVLRVGWWIGPHLPWRIVSRLPIFQVVSTTRFILYVSLVGAALVGWAVSRLARPSRAAVLAMVLAALALVPNVSRPGWWGPAAVPRLISSPSLLRRWVAPGEVAMVLPYYYAGYGTYWQAASGFRLTLADGYLYSGLPTPWNLIQLPYFLANHEILSSESAAAQFRALLSMSHVGVVLVQQPTPPSEMALLRRAGLVNRGIVGGVGVWNVPPHMRQGGQSGEALFRTALAAVDVAEQRDAVRVIRAVERYTQAGSPVAKLTLARLEREDLLPRTEGLSAVPLPWQRTAWGIAFKPLEPSRILVAVPWIQAGTLGQIARQVGGSVRAKFFPEPPVTPSQPAGMTVGFGELTITVRSPAH